jgi:hypothetical protein
MLGSRRGARFAGVVAAVVVLVTGGGAMATASAKAGGSGGGGGGGGGASSTIAASREGCDGTEPTTTCTTAASADAATGRLVTEATATATSPSDRLAFAQAWLRRRVALPAAAPAATVTFDVNVLRAEAGRLAPVPGSYVAIVADAVGCSGRCTATTEVHLAHTDPSTPVAGTGPQTVTLTLTDPSGRAVPTSPITTTLQLVAVAGRTTWFPTWVGSAWGKGEALAGPVTVAAAAAPNDGATGA